MAELIYRVGDGEPMVIVHCCNDQGTWGAGFSGALSRRYPVAEDAYRNWPGFGLPYALGEIRVIEVYNGQGLWICNLVAQHGYRGYNWGAGDDRRFPPFVRYWAIRKGLRALREQILGALPWVPKSSRWASVHCPRLGCGLAGGRWEEVEPILQEELVDRGIDVVVYDLKGE